MSVFQPRSVLLLVLLILGLAWFLAAPVSIAPAQDQTAAQGPSEGASAAYSPSPEEQWSALLQRQPYLYRTLPAPPGPSELDGNYFKSDPSQEAHVHCRRCPDWAVEGGVWKLHLDQGIFRVFHPSTGWRSLGSFVVAGDRVILLNDPVCHELTGTYTWSRQGNELVFTLVADDCASGLRAENLTKQPWQACRPGPKPAGTATAGPEPAPCP
ncbi:MAG: hypothetical protein AB1896_10265 [Thermodesulfobacteriota bacterium]